MKPSHYRKHLLNGNTVASCIRNARQIKKKSEDPPGRPSAPAAARRPAGSSQPIREPRAAQIAAAGGAGTPLR